MAELQQIGPYKITRVIGKGGMGRVYEGINEQIQRRVAIKVLHSQFAENSLVVQRFLNEARAVNIVKHRCLVDCYEFGQLPDGSAYIVMEYLDGDTLHERLWKLGGKLPLDAALRYARQIALALAAVHAKGIIHRDLKPANIMLVEDPETGAQDWVKVLDFGLARVREPTEERGRLTQTGVVMGTPAYMSPEQVRSARSVVDRSDVYTLGIMLYEMISGQKPFTSASDAEVMFMHMSTEAPPLQNVAPTAPPAVCELVQRMLKKKPEDRPTAAQVASTLSRFTSQGSSSAIPILPDSKAGASGDELGFAATQEAPQLRVPDPAPTSAPTAMPTPDAVSTATGAAAQKSSPPKDRKQRLRLLLGGGLLVLLAGGLGTVFVVRGIRSEDAEHVSWSIRSVPAGAEVVAEDGHILGRTPLSSQPKKGPGTQTLLLRLHGYNEAHVTCESSSDCERETMLVADAGTEPEPPPAGAAGQTTSSPTGKDNTTKSTDGKPGRPDGKKKSRGKGKRNKGPAAY